MGPTPSPDPPDLEGAVESPRALAAEESEGADTINVEVLEMGRIEGLEVFCAAELVELVVDGDAEDRVTDSDVLLRSVIGSRAEGGPMETSGVVRTEAEVDSDSATARVGGERPNGSPTTMPPPG
jgi:hypothetical protein